MSKSWSFSRLGTYLECEQRYQYKYLDNIKPEDDGDRTALQVGSMFHAGMEAALHNWNTSPIASATHAANNHEDASNTYAHETAVEMFDTYIPRLIDMGVQPFIWDGSPLIEYEFEVAFIDGISLRGIIDAVIEVNGVVYLVDWKARKYFADLQAVRLDAQLYLYASAAFDKLGIPIDKAAQVQFSTDLPSVPKLNQSLEPVADNINGTLGRTTFETFKHHCEKLGLSEDETEAALLRFGSKIVDLSEFMRISSVNIDNRIHYVKQFIKLARRADNTNYGDFVPTFKAHVCKWCDFKRHCYKEHGKF